MLVDKIVISGVQSTGKTTLINFIESDPLGKLFDIEKEIVRKLKVPINKASSHEGQMAILEAHYHNCLQSRDKPMITDRGAIDAFVYATYNYLSGGFTFFEHEQHRKVFEACIPYYTHFFYLPIEFDAVSDSVRDTDEVYREDLASLYETIYKRYGINHIPLVGSVKERFSAFFSYV